MKRCAPTSLRLQNSFVDAWLEMLHKGAALAHEQLHERRHNTLDAMERSRRAIAPATNKISFLFERSESFGAPGFRGRSRNDSGVHLPAAIRLQGFTRQSWTQPGRRGSAPSPHPYDTALGRADSLTSL